MHSKASHSKVPSCPAGYSDLQLPFQLGDTRLATSDPKGDPSRLFFKLYGHENRKSVLGHVRFGKWLIGPPGHAHGGAIAYCLDETMGSAAWYAGKPVVAESIEVKYHHMIPLDEVVQVKAEVVSEDGKRVLVEATLTSVDEQRVFATATGKFHILGRKQLEALADKASVHFIDWFKKNMPTSEE